MCTLNFDTWRRFRFGPSQAVLEAIEKEALLLILKGPRVSNPKEENARILSELETTEELASIMRLISDLPEEVRPRSNEPMKIVLWALQLGGEVVESTRRTG